MLFLLPVGLVTIIDLIGLLVDKSTFNLLNGYLAQLLQQNQNRFDFHLLAYFDTFNAL